MSDAEVATLMEQADAFVSTSRQESFGIAPMKAIAHGCRAVLSDIPSHREIVQAVGADVARLRCLRGVDTLTAVGLVAEIGDITALAHPKRLAS